MANETTAALAQPHNGLVRFYEVNSPLLEFRSDITSQCGEDGIIARIVDLIQPRRRYCVEFGAWDGMKYSNCYNLLANYNWHGVMIEANAEKFRELQATYANNDRVALVNRHVNFAGADTLDGILDECSAPEDPALVSIDIDGNDYYIFESLATHRPEVVVIEFNPTIPNDVFFVQEKSFSVNHGCSLLALVQLGKSKGYELAACTELNAFFVRSDKFGRLGIANNHIFNLYAPVQDGRIFQGYDGSIHVVGMDRMIWKGGRPVSSADFQVTPEAERFFADAQR
jgi:hypothetical protein